MFLHSRYTEAANARKPFPTCPAAPMAAWANCGARPERKLSTLLPEFSSSSLRLVVSTP